MNIMMKKQFSKKGLFLFTVIAIIAVIGIVMIGVFWTSGSFFNTMDTYGTNVTYRDEARTIPIGTEISYDISHIKSDPYAIKTDDSGSLPMSYTANIERGNIAIRIKDGNKVIKEYKVKRKETFSVKLKPNHDYTIEVYIQSGKGTLNLMWMEMIS